MRNAAVAQRQPVRSFERWQINDEETRLMKSLLIRVLALSAALAAAAPPLLAQTAAPTPSQTLHLRSLAATCANCHGTNGRAVPREAMLPLAGRPAAEIVEQFTAFRDGKRPATVMHQIAKGYTDEQIAALAAYFAAQPK
jgi:cytochrome subunit of sulfide dehydrogenase